MKVLVISPTFPPMRSGGADFAFRQCQRLADRGVQVQVVTSDIEKIVTSETFRILPVMRRWSWRELLKLVRITARFRPDVVEIHFTGTIYNQHPMVTFLPTLLKRCVANVRIILLIEYPEPIMSPVLRLFAGLIRTACKTIGGRQVIDHGYGRLLRDSDQIIVLCDSHRAALARYYEDVGKKCVTIPPPPPIEICDDTDGQAAHRGRAQLQLAPTDILLAYYGYIYPNKGVETLLDAFHRVVRNTPNVRLVLVGGANEVVLKAANRPHYVEELKDRSRQLGMADKVLWTDYFPADSEQPSVFLRAANICILPFDDGVSMHRSTFAAAAAHGLPIVTTRGKTLETPFVDGHNVLLCPAKDPPALAETIARLISDPKLQLRLRNGAQSLTREYFSWERCIDRTISVFQANAI
jgi:glycosyltransferase involved in cell wall biosynthesis